MTEGPPVIRRGDGVRHLSPGEEPVRSWSNPSRGTALRQPQVPGTRKERFRGRDRKKATRHGDRRQQRGGTGRQFHAAREQHHRATRVVVIRLGRVWMRMTLAVRVGPLVQPPVGDRAGGEDRKREHQRRRDSGEQPESEGGQVRGAWHGAEVCPPRRFVKPPRRAGQPWRLRLSAAGPRRQDFCLPVTHEAPPPSPRPRRRAALRRRQEDRPHRRQTQPSARDA